jgi:hypothetical protein
VRAGLVSVAAGLATVLLLAAGCSDKQNGTALPATGATTTNPTDVPTSERTTTPPSSTGTAPRVSDPLDATKFLPQPCTALSAAALQAMNTTKPGEPDTDSAVAKSAGPSCIWTSDDKPESTVFSVGFITGNKNGLSDTYRGGKKAFPGYFEPTEVDGYPAVFNDLTDDRSNGACNLTVGISETMAFRTGIDASRDTGTRACDIAKQVAAAAIKTLREG